MQKRRVVITGLGVVACNGIGKEDFWKANIEGRSGIDVITAFDHQDFDCHIAGEVKNFVPSQYMPSQVVSKVDRFVHFGLAASKMAIDDSRLDMTQEDKYRVGVVMGSGLGGCIFHEEQMIAAFDKGAHRMNPLCVPKITPNAVSSHIAIVNGFFGHNMVISTACASGTQAIGEALRKIQCSDLDVCITGGVEASLTRFTFGAYCSLRVISKGKGLPSEASRPFDRLRDGFVLAEGGGVLILEELEHALKRNAHIYAEVTGYAGNSGAYHIVMPDPEGQDATRAMAGAVKDAALKPEDIDYINAHATSTSANDQAETKAIKNVFGERAYQIPVSSTKSMIGHSIGAAGGIEGVVCALTIENQFIPPTINYQEKDPACDLDYVSNKGRSAKINHVLSNSFGFGNCNACLVFSKLSAKGFSNN
ncbi:MAG: beta-ketoacyl-ACP synthase II [Candidatus Omnitrophica bacterium]|nr:beta-ketoacyl-ACP synthase II [Candidatus Omnitrophota bacterium]